MDRCPGVSYRRGRYAVKNSCLEAEKILPGFVCENIGMYRKRFDGMNSSIAFALDEIGEWWTLLIVRECMRGSTRFTELQTRLGIARNILSTRLERLTQLGIIERYKLPDRANTSGYRLTRKGADLHTVLTALMRWGDRWLLPQRTPSDAANQRLEDGPNL
jgi:DNA-binding HxlR family transcriptional regulator